MKVWSFWKQVQVFKVGALKFFKKLTKRLNFIDRFLVSILVLAKCSFYTVCSFWWNGVGWGLYHKNLNLNPLLIPMSWSQAQVGITTNDGWLLKIRTNLVIIRVVIRIHNFIFQKNQWFNIFIILFNWNNQTINPPINFQIFHKRHWLLKWLWPLDFFLNFSKT
jgi:hypothetical protein